MDIDEEELIGLVAKMKVAEHQCDYWQKRSLELEEEMKRLKAEIERLENERLH
jgi:hypothetical protein